TQPGSDIYHVTYTPFPASMNEWPFVERFLPDKTRVLLSVLPSQSQLLCPTDDSSTQQHPSTLFMWRLNAGELSTVAQIPLCNSWDLASQFPHDEMPTSFLAWAPVTSRIPNAHADLGEAIYTWNASFVSAYRTYFPEAVVIQPPDGETPAATE